MTRRERRTALHLKAPSAWRFVIIALCIPALLGALAVWLRAEYRHAEHALAQTSRSFDRRIEQITLLSRLKDAETAQRGYLLTGDEAFLAHYAPARRDIMRSLAADRATADPDVDPHYLPVVDGLVRRKFDELDRTIALYRSGETASALRIARTGHGRQTMDRLRTLVGRMIVAEHIRSSDRRAAFLTYRAWLQRAVNGVVLLFVAALFAALIIMWHLRRQGHALLVEAFEAAERHATVLDSTTDVILILDPNGTIETVNAAATRLLGYTADELTQRDVAVVVDLAPGEGSFHNRVGLIDGQLRQSFLPGRTARRRDGREVAVDVAIGVMNVASGDHLVVTLRDISERNRIERVKDDLMSTVSHELRTPLTSIVGSLGLLRAGVAGTLPLEAARLIEIAENNSRRLIRLINDMLDIDRIGSGKLAIVFQPVDLAGVIGQACLGSEGLARAGDVTLACTTPDRPLIVSGDADRLVQVVTNLLSNAIRFTPRQSTVELELRAEGGSGIISVADRGIGIPPAFRDRIFGRFERAAGDDGARERAWVLQSPVKS